MTYCEFTSNMYKMWNSRIQRLGQHAFNFLHEVKPDLANKIRSTRFDPFYQDERMGDFLNVVAENWDRPPEEIVIEERQESNVRNFGTSCRFRTGEAGTDRSEG